MSKRTRLKLRNMKLFVSKYILNGRYVVRNILAITIAITFVALTIGTVKLVQMNVGNGEEVVETAVEENVLVVTADAQLDTKSIDLLRGVLDNSHTAVVQADSKQVVANAQNFADKCVSTSDDVSIVKSASEKSEIVGTLPDGAVGDIVSTSGEWYRIKSGDVEGFVKTSSVLSGEKAAKYAKDFYFLYGEVTDDDVCIRTQASKEADIMEPAYMDVKYDVDKSKTTDEWVCVVIHSGDKGFVNADYMNVVEGYPTAIPAESKDKNAEEKDTEATTTEKTSETTEKDSSETTTEKEATSEATTTEEEEPTTTETTTEATTEDDSKNNETNPGTSNRGAISFSEEDINLIASVLTLECGGECYEGQLAVANVIINRYLNGSWGSSVSDVIYAPCQFSVTSSPMLDYYIQNGAQASCIQAVRDAASGINNIGSYMYFRPTWNVDTSSIGSYTIIGNHVFY